MGLSHSRSGRGRPAAGLKGLREDSTGPVAAALAASLVISVMPALAQTPEIDARGAALVDEFVEILKQPDEEKRAGLSDFLAVEFQIVRSSGVRMDQAGYLETPATVFEVSISDVHATEADGVLVVSYVLSVDDS